MRKKDKLSVQVPSQCQRGALAAGVDVMGQLAAAAIMQEDSVSSVPVFGTRHA